MLTLYTIATFMDRNGFAYPAQPTIAKGARASKRTVQRHIQAAIDAGWLGVELAGRGGQGWRHNAYRACVPDDLPLDDLDEQLADVAASQFGDIEGDDTAMSPRSPSTSLKRDDNGDAKVTTSRAEGDDKSRKGGDTAMAHKLSLLELSPITHAKREAPIAEDSNQRALPNTSFLEMGKEPGSLPRKTHAGLKQPAIRRQITDADLWLKIKAFDAAGERNTANVVKALEHHYQDVTNERVSRLLVANGRMDQPRGIAI